MWSELESNLDQSPDHQHDIDNFQTSFIWRQKVSVGRRKRWCCVYKKVILDFLWWNMFDQKIILSEKYFSSQYLLSECWRTPPTSSTSTAWILWGGADSDILLKIFTQNINFRRTALLMAIDNENMEMLELLLENKVDLIINNNNNNNNG